MGSNVESKDRLIDVRAVADKLGCDPRTVYRWANDGKMPRGNKCGGLRRWWEREIDEWIAGGCKPVRELDSVNAIGHN
ncbi:MAG: helix-turn-helix domain-containing protein [Phycisphaerales bacterium]|nr:helix-turn-helix domain-containing protein [Phycisphaerales bacterium]